MTQDASPLLRDEGIARASVSAAFGLLLVCSPLFAAPTALKPDEQVFFFPSIARPLTNGAWEVRIHGWAFEYERRPLGVPALSKSLGLDAELTDDADRALFAVRARWFLTDNERGKRVTVQLGERQIAMPVSQPNGHFTTNILLTVPELARLRDSGALANNVLRFRAVLGPKDTREFAGTAMLVGASGLTVVSDIDDTIKVTEVRDRKATLRNTFARPFRAVDGMAPAYERWGREAGVTFHYVSASPWQLAPALTEFAKTNAFPAGTWHLKTFRWKDESFFNLFQSPESYKLGVIEPLMAQFPGRRFVFVGDSGEKDPEIYGTIARRFPEQAVRIFIRDVTDEPADAPRYKDAFDGVPRAKWSVFKDAKELPGTLR